MTSTRRQQFSQATRRTLVAVAREQFTEQGYAATSLDAVVAGAQLTKGALYHHFSGKQALFEAVFAEVEDEAALRIREAIDGHADPWEKADAGLGAFLDVVSGPTYRRIVIQDGPAVLGYERFREQEERSAFATVREIVDAVLAAGSVDLEDDLVTTFSRIFVGALSAAGDEVTGSQDTAAAIRRVRAAMGLILTGLRSILDPPA